MAGWILFNLLIVILLAIDLFVFHGKSHEIKMREALIWSVVWTVVALIFNLYIWMTSGKEAGLLFFTGYLLERSLSFDNLFVFLVIFAYFKVPATYQHGVLFWGIVGALVMRAFFIFAGVALLHAFHWMLYVFGAILIYTGVKLVLEKDKEVEPEKNFILKGFRKMMPVTTQYHGSKFFCKQNGQLAATPLFVVLLVIESTDVVF